MTIIQLAVFDPSPGFDIPATGHQYWTPTRVRKKDTSIITVRPFKIDLLGLKEFPVDPTDESWVWKVESQFAGFKSTQFLMVPDQESIAFTDLVEIDPTTLEPVATPQPAWYAYVDQLALTTTQAKDAAVAAELEAFNAKQAAFNSRDSASASASSAAFSAGNASTSASNASASASQASSSASQAINARDSATNAQASAAGFASAASGSADEAEEHAQAAIQAEAHAIAVADGFSIGTVVTVSPTTPASATITGELAERELNLDIPRGHTPVFTIVETTTGPETPGQQGVPGVKGDKGDPGGFVSTPLPVNTDLNTIFTEGLFRVIASPTTPEGVTANLPINEAGSLTVTLSQTGTTQIQTYTTNTKSIYVRRRFNSAWGLWRAFTSSRVDTTSGRVMYSYDDVNSRDQMIYGDTGWRDITSLVANGWTATKVAIRRYGSTVSLRLYQVNGAAQTAITILSLQAGFRSGVFQYEPCYTENAALATILVESTGNIKAAGGALKYGTAAYSEIKWSTTETWPASLPGTADGSIPV